METGRWVKIFATAEDLPTLGRPIRIREQSAMNVTIQNIGYQVLTTPMTNSFS